MTVLYRYSAAPPFGRGTFWTTREDSAEFVAQLEAGTPIIPRGQIYRAEVTVGGSAATQPVDDALHLVHDRSTGEALPLLRDELVSKGERAGVDWVQFTDHGREWKGAMLYLGEKPVPAQPVAGLIQRA